MKDQPLSEASMARECLKHLGDEKSVLHRAAHALEVVAHSSVGLGEVLQDYANQSWSQLCEVIRAAQNGACGVATPDDIEILQNVHLIIKSAKTVLESTPAAMQRNKAESIGKLSRADLVEITHAFVHSSDIAMLLASEDSGQALASLVAGSEPTGLVIPGAAHLLPFSTRH
jgi:hypothetical protein